MKANGLIKLAGIIITIAAMGGSGIYGYAKLNGKVEKNTEEVEELEDEHKEDVKDINGKLETIAKLMQSQAIVQGKIQTNIEYIQRDILEIKNK